MSVTTDLVLGALVTDVANWTQVGGTGGAVLNSDDGATSLWRISSGTNVIETCATSGLDPAEVNSINSVSLVTFKVRNNAGAACTFYGGVRLGASDTYGAARTPPADAVFRTYNEGALARPGGGSWVPGDLLNLEFAAKGSYSGNVGDLTYAVIRVDYEPVVAGDDCLVS